LDGINLSAQKTTFNLDLSGDFKEALNGQEFSLNKDENLEFTPWEYHFLVKK